MNNEEANTDEIVIVGSRYGDLADVVTPFYEKGTPIEPEDIRKTLGCDEAVLMAVPNKHDAYAVGVFTLEEKRIGHVWMSQAPAVCRWLEQSKRDYVSVRIKRINTCCGLMIAEPVEALKLTPCERGAETFDETWAANLPEILCSINEQSLSLGLALLRDELAEANCWSERLQLRIDNLLTKLPVDLSARYYRDSINLYKAMKNSRIAEVRQYSDIVLNAFVSRGSKNQMEWWVNEWLPDFFTEAAEGDLLGIFEADGYTLERVEELLLKAPNHLYHLYKVNRERFANHLYYSALPQTLYNRLLTLLAVREAMMKKIEHSVTTELPAELTTEKKFKKCIDVLIDEKVLMNKYDYTWIMEASNQTQGMPKFNTPSSFKDYIEKIGIGWVPSEDSINRKQNRFSGKFPEWTFTDCDTTEANRRINVGKRFLNVFRGLL